MAFEKKISETRLRSGAAKDELGLSKEKWNNVSSPVAFPAIAQAVYLICDLCACARACAHVCVCVCVERGGREGVCGFQETCMQSTRNNAGSRSDAARQRLCTGEMGVFTDPREGVISADCVRSHA